MTTAQLLEHREGCPAKPERIETFKAYRPPFGLGGVVFVTRCQDRAEQVEGPPR